MGAIATVLAALAASMGLAAPQPGDVTRPGAAVERTPPPIFGDWRTYTKADGLPGDKVLYIRAAGEALWVGTEHGLARIEDDKVVQVLGVEDGLAHRVVLCIDIGEDGDVWAATMGGLSHYSAGRFQSFNQFNSGLPNDVVFGVADCGREVWVATTSGIGRYDTWTGSWALYDEKNAPMHEIWGYFVTCARPNYVYAAVWGGGVLEFDRTREHWRAYVDPDGEMEIDLFRDDGLVHNITTAVDYAEGILWVATYFGLSTYDGRSWRGYMDHDSGLAGNFINNVRAVGDAAWIATDRGLSWFDRKQWVTYTRTEDGHGRVRLGFGPDARVVETDTAMVHDFVFAAEQAGDTLWVATGKGLSRAHRLAALPAAK